MRPTTAALGVNGQAVRLMILSSPRPDARAYAAGTREAPLDPDRVPVAATGDNALPEYQFELVKVKSTAQSPFWRAPTANPVYRTPIIAASVPAGTSYAVEYRGAADKNGTSATAWSHDIGIANGRPFVQFRVVFRANWQTLAAPSLDTVVIPVD